MSSATSNKFRFQLLSDIHLEFMLPPPVSSIKNDDPNLQQEITESIQKDELLRTFFDTKDNHATAPYLALLGDIGLASTDPHDYFGLQLLPFLKMCCSKYQHVFYVAGNHEYYLSSIQKVNDNLTKLDEQIPNFHFLNRTVFDLDLLASSLSTSSETAIINNNNNKIRILGTTLWTRCEAAARNVLNDFSKIKKFGVDEMWELHDQDVSFLQQELAKAQRENVPCVVFTHHVPLLAGAALPNDEDEQEFEQTYKITGTDLLPKAFESILATESSKILKGWCWGHSHHNFKNHVAVIAGVKCMTNQYGYPSDPYKKLPDYQKCEIGKVFEVDVAVETSEKGKEQEEK